MKNIIVVFIFSMLGASVCAQKRLRSDASYLVSNRDFFDRITEDAQITYFPVGIDAIKTLEAFPLGALFALNLQANSELHQLSWEKLSRVLLDAPNPLRKDQPTTIIVVLPIYRQDDIITLVGVEYKAIGCNFLFDALTKGTQSPDNIIGAAIITLPIGKVAQTSRGFSYNVNSTMDSPAPSGYTRFRGYSSATGRMFQ